MRLTVKGGEPTVLEQDQRGAGSAPGGTADERIGWDGLNPEEILLSANALFHADQSKDLRSAIAEKIEALGHYDVLAMDNVVAICCWGRSGSLLLASYFDGHEDLVMLPATSGMLIHKFFERYQSLSLRDKLIAYPVFTKIYDPFYDPLFDGDFAIVPAEYYAAVQAILEFYSDWPPEFLESRRAFFLFVHIAYNLALGRIPANSHPLIVYAMHERDDAVAKNLVKDFPRTKFVHTIRDPISLFDRMFDNWFNWFRDLPPGEPLPNSVTAVTSLHGIPLDVFTYLVNRDRPHTGMESRTRTIRFEDLHCDAHETMRDLTEWLGISYHAKLLDSTFNGIPYVVTREGKAWSGQRREQAQRHSQNLSRKDRGLLFALFYENFAAWGYPCPKIFGNPIVRWIVFTALLLVPMKTEITVARVVFKNRILPSIRRGNCLIGLKSLGRAVLCRLGIVALILPEFLWRRAHRKTLLTVDLKLRRNEPAL